MRMPDCQQYQNQVNQLQAQIATQQQYCTELSGMDRIQCDQEVGRLRDRLWRAQDALSNCQAGLPGPGVQETQGHVTYLRVHDLGTGWGPPEDSMDVEVVFYLDTQPNRAFGFQLRDDTERPARTGMLALLRDAFIHDRNVVVDYTQVLNHRNAVAFRIAVTNAPI
jgi:hypothetical protein